MSISCPSSLAIASASRRSRTPASTSPCIPRAVPSALSERPSASRLPDARAIASASSASSFASVSRACTMRFLASWDSSVARSSL